MLNAKPRWLQIAAAIGICLLATFLVGGVYSLAAGEGPPGVFLGSTLGFSAVLIYLHFKHPNTNAPEAMLGNLSTRLAEAELSRYSLHIDVHSEHPLPLVIGRRVMLSPSMLNDLSPNALTWAAVSEATAEDWQPRFLYWLFGALLLLSLIGIGLARRFDASFGWWCLALAGIPLAFAVALGVSHRTSLRADVDVTRTEADYRAAKEALSYAYFAQADRPFYDKLALLRSGLARRAMALGIELERGYRASVGSDSPIETS